MFEPDVDLHLRAPAAGELEAVAELLGLAMADNPPTWPPTAATAPCE